MKKSLKYLNQTPIIPSSRTTTAAYIESSSSSSASISTTQSNGGGLKAQQQMMMINSTTNACNNNNKFYQTFKTLFDIFDPEQRGYIDINELELLGANQNEILNDIISYLKNNQNITSFVTFNTFVNAADIVLKKRKLVKSQLKQNYKKTLSEELANDQQKRSHHHHLQQQQQHLSNKTNPNEPFVLQNANSYDLNILLEQENCLLNDGLIELNRIKLYFEQKLNENRLKKLNISKLKHQNLFSIDKMLLNLNEINSLNKYLNAFNQNNEENNENSSNTSFDDDLNMLLKTAQLTVTPPQLPKEPPPPLPSSSTAVLSDCSNINQYDKFIKEKQERIDSLQKEKSNLIRKLFEVKSKLTENPTTTAAIEIKQQQQQPMNNEELEKTKHEDYLFE